MGNPEALLRCAALVEEKLKEPISVQDMSEAACWSLYHFCRVFTEAMDMGPYDYLVRRRVTEAAHELAVSGGRVTDLAFEYQFGSPEIFSRCFRRALGVLPSRLHEIDAAARFLPPLTRELAECISSRATRPRVSAVESPSLRLRGLAVLANLGPDQRLADLDTEPLLERLRRATADLPRQSPTAYAVLDRVAPTSASLFLGSPALPGAEGHPAGLEITLPEGRCFRSAAEAELPLPLLRAHFHRLWCPARSCSRASEREVFRWSCAAAERRLELLVPVEGSG